MYPAKAIAAAVRPAQAFDDVMREVGVPPADAMLLRLGLLRLGMVGYSPDEVAGALLRWKNRSSKEAFQLGYEEASVLTQGNPQSALFTPFDDTE